MAREIDLSGRSLSGCPDDMLLAELVEGRLDDARTQELQAHADACDACREAIAALVRAGRRVEATPAAAAGQRYRIEREVARGGMGVVLEAHDTNLARRVALKQLLVEDDDTRGRFQREVQLTARLQHPGIVPVYEAGTLEN